MSHRMMGLLSLGRYGVTVCLRFWEDSVGHLDVDMYYCIFCMINRNVTAENRFLPDINCSKEQWNLDQMFPGLNELRKSYLTLANVKPLNEKPAKKTYLQLKLVYSIFYCPLHLYLWNAVNESGGRKKRKKRNLKQRGLVIVSHVTAASLTVVHCSEHNNRVYAAAPPEDTMSSLWVLETSFKLVLSINISGKKTVRRLSGLTVSCTSARCIFSL